MACKGKGSKKVERKVRADAKENNPLKKEKNQNGIIYWI